MSENTAASNIADEKEIRAFLSSVMNNNANSEDKPKISDRMKAAEMLAKCYNMFGDGKPSSNDEAISRLTDELFK